LRTCAKAPGNEFAAPQPNDAGQERRGCQKQ
jgi:hypothetical protein